MGTLERKVAELEMVVDALVKTVGQQGETISALSALAVAQARDSKTTTEILSAHADWLREMGDAVIENRKGMNDLVVANNAICDAIQVTRGETALLAQALGFTVQVVGPDA